MTAARLTFKRWTRLDLARAHYPCGKMPLIIDLRGYKTEVAGEAILRWSRTFLTQTRAFRGAGMLAT